MHIQEYIRTIRADLATNTHQSLSSYTLEKPEHFNWAEDVFYELNVKAFPDDRALIWKYQDQEEVYSFREMYHLCNQLINLLRKHGAQPGDHIYSLL
ncbi:MAG: branched-chain amino acid aminotransferase, partial [Bacteroidota bacterium]